VRWLAAQLEPAFMILLIGPTGQTARRIIQYSREAGVELRLAARDPETARAKLGALAGGFAVVGVDARNRATIETALEPGDVLLNAATPAGLLGHTLARAAIAAGAHYVAFSGEVVDSLQMLRELDGPARARGVTLCPAAGSSGALGDFALRLALDKLPGASDGLIGSAITGFTPSYGTMLSEMHIMNGPGVIVRDGELVEEDVTGQIIRHRGKMFVERPLTDAMMAWTYAGLRNLRAGIEVPAEQAEAVAQQFRNSAALLKSDAGRAQYENSIAATIDVDIAENENSPEGTRTGFVWNQSDGATAVITARPVYEATARAALLVSRELDELSDRPSGFQAASSIVRSMDYALTAVRSRILA
jgi:hypothetical protein